MLSVPFCYNLTTLCGFHCNCSLSETVNQITHLCPGLDFVDCPSLGNVAGLDVGRPRQPGDLPAELVGAGELPHDVGMCRADRCRSGRIFWKTFYSLFVIVAFYSILIVTLKGFRGKTDSFLLFFLASWCFYLSI